MFPNPIAHFYEAQAAATAEIVRAALSGAQRIQQLTLQMMRAGAAANSTPPAEQGARFQQEVMQAFAEMNNEIVRASYSMMEKMRDTLGAATQSSIPTMPAFPLGGDASNPMAIYDSAMRQWQTNLQQMMQAPAAARAMGFVDDDRAGSRAGSDRQSARKTAGKSPRGKRKSATRKR